MCNFLFYLILVLAHNYGQNGRESTKIDTKSVAFDFELFENFTKIDFITHLYANIDKFVEYLNNTKGM